MSSGMAVLALLNHIATIILFGTGLAAHGRSPGPISALCIPPIARRFAQRFVMAACFIRELYQSLKVPINLPKFTQNEHIAGRQYRRQQHRYANGNQQVGHLSLSGQSRPKRTHYLTTAQ
jgi:hypothetical protein